MDGIDNNEDEHIKEQETKEEENFKDTVRCTLCPVAKPRYVCGSDNNTYSSVCRLNYHNCVQNMNVHVMCMNFCPCTGKY